MHSPILRPIGRRAEVHTQLLRRRATPDRARLRPRRATPRREYVQVRRDVGGRQIRPGDASRDVRPPRKRGLGSIRIRPSGIVIGTTRARRNIPIFDTSHHIRSRRATRAREVASGHKGRGRQIARQGEHAQYRAQGHQAETRIRGVHVRPVEGGDFHSRASAVESEDRRMQQFGGEETEQQQIVQ